VPRHRVGAAGLHSLPSAVFAGVKHTVAFLEALCRFSLKAPTRLSSAIHKATGVCGSGVPAIAGTNPICQAAISSTHYYKPTKSLTSKVRVFLHNILHNAAPLVGRGNRSGVRCSGATLATGVL
jgi:hypothetical protein